MLLPKLLSAALCIRLVHSQNLMDKKISVSIASIGANSSGLDPSGEKQAELTTPPGSPIRRRKRGVQIRIQGLGLPRVNFQGSCECARGLLATISNDCSFGRRVYHWCPKFLLRSVLVFAEKPRV